MVLGEQYAKLLRRLVLPIGDWWRDIPIGGALRILEQSQWLPRAELERMQYRKLHRLLDEAYANVPYYRDMMDSHRVRPRDIGSVDDLPKLPLLTGEIIRKAGVERMLNRRIPRRERTMLRTSGSTGIPKEFWLSKTARAWDRASFYRFVQWFGGDRGHTMFMVWGRPLVISGWNRVRLALKLRFLSREVVLSAWMMTPETMERFLQRLRSTGPSIVRGYTSALVRLANYVLNQRADVPPVKAISTTAEQILPHERDLLENVFRAKVFDQYGCGECNGVACECAAHSGLHVAMEHCIVEIVDEQGRRVPRGVSGRVVLTNLDNEAFPFIRYVCGDEASLLETECSCGRSLPLMSSVLGRSADSIYGLNGNKVWGGFFRTAMMQLGLIEKLGVREFQFRQTGPGRIELHLASECPPTADQVESLRNIICAYLGSMELGLRQVDRIERGPGNKLRYTIREWQPPGEAVTGALQSIVGP